VGEVEAAVCAMKKNPPTLADAVLMTALDKASPYRQKPEICRFLERIAYARKFVLDVPMSKYLADLSITFWRGNRKKQSIMLENARRMARLPHKLTWIEFEFASGYFVRSKEIGSLKIADINGKEPLRYGWLIEQHEKVETAFKATEIRTSSKLHGNAFTHPLSIQWCSDDSPLMWEMYQVLQAGDRIMGAEWMAQMEGYESSQLGWTSTFSWETSDDMLRWMVGATKHNPDNYPVLLPRMPIRDLWALLATINDLPVKITTVEPSRGYMARGNYKKFLKHSIVHLTVPETQFRRLIAKSAVLLRRRAHQVRGHWRNDWRHPLSVLCEHVYDEEMCCINCRGRQLWIAEHQRGDTSLGFVTHDYEVGHRVP
jgi:hypothetical protein